MKTRFLWASVLFLGLGRAAPSAADRLVAGTFEAGVAQLQQAIDHASEQGDFGRVQALRLDLAKRYASAQRYGDAARQYELLLASRPFKRQRVELSIQLGKMRYALQDYNAAIGAFQDALHDDPRSWDARLALARAYAQVELNARAQEEYQRCIALNPQAPEAYRELAGVYQRLIHYDKAISFYEKALRLQASPEAFLGLADCYVHEDNVPRALEVLQQARAVLPPADYDIRLGDIYRKQGELAHAASSWEAALKLDPQRDDLRLNLALLDGQLHRYAQADQLFGKLLETYPRSPLVHFLRAWALFDRGEHRAAKAEALTVRALEPTELVQHYNDRLLARLEKSL